MNKTGVCFSLVIGASHHGYNSMHDQFRFQCSEESLLCWGELGAESVRITYTYAYGTRRSQLWYAGG
jgi:hypothetical protein